MSRRKPIDAKILEANKEFDAHIFAETVKGTFSDFPESNLPVPALWVILPLL
jgi:hypothetical protein